MDNPDSDINSLIDAVSQLYDRLDRLEINTQQEIKAWSQTNLELMAIINRQGNAIERFGDTAGQMAQTWEKSKDWEERFSWETLREREPNSKTGCSNSKNGSRPAKKPGKKQQTSVSPTIRPHP